MCFQFDSMQMIQLIIMKFLSQHFFLNISDSDFYFKNGSSFFLLFTYSIPSNLVTTNALLLMSLLCTIMLLQSHSINSF